MTLTKTLPALDNFVDISPASIASFRTNGHVLMPGLLQADEVAIYRDAIVSAAEKFNTEKRKLEERDTYGKAFLQIMNLWQVDASVRRFVLAKRFGKMASDLLGVSNVRIYHDQALFKEPGGGPTPWHQDQYYWPIDTHNTITMWMPLVDIDEDMGMLTFASASHTKGAIFNHEISDASEKEFDRYVHDNNLAVTSPPFMKAGDATWHYGFTIHSAPGNRSNKMREVMTIIYVADQARVTQPINTWQENDRQKWLMGLPVDSIVNSSLNPTVL